MSHTLFKNIMFLFFIYLYILKIYHVFVFSNNLTIDMVKEIGLFIYDCLFLNFFWICSFLLLIFILFKI